MNRDRIAFIEHLALRSDLGLNDVCQHLASDLGLQPFQFDSENETEWGSVEVDGVEVNVSKPYEVGTLQRWDSTTPRACNFGILLIIATGHPVYSDHERAVEGLVPSYAQGIADALMTDVYHHRWWGPGGSRQIANVYRPSRSQV